MSASFYNLLKYAATGIASPDMTHFDKMRASTLMGGVVQTLTGQPPLTFKADGTPLISWSMKGNGQQTGTPTPDNPVMPEFVGVRTKNLLYSSKSQTAGSILSVEQVEGVTSFILSKSVTQNDTSATVAVDITLEAGSYTFSVMGLNRFDTSYDRIFMRDDDGTIIAQNCQTNKPITFTLTEATHINRLTFVSAPLSTYSKSEVKIMLNSGTTALPYEPYGWAEKITCAGQTVPVYLGQTQTVRRVKKLVLTGEETVESGSTTVYIQRPDMLAYSQAVCSHYQYFDGLISGAPDMSIATGSGAGTSFWFKDSGYDNDAAGFKSYLASQYQAGHPVTVWYVLAEPSTGIVNEPLCKIGDYADELSSEDAGVSIPTAKGQNTLTVDTELQPSEMTITYKG